MSAPDRRRRIAIYSGLAAPAIALVTIFVAATIDPNFNWLDSALSNTGELPSGSDVSLALLSEKPSFFVFNGGLILTGLVGLPFAWLLHEDARNPVHSIAAVIFALGLLSLGSVGWFYLPKDLHGTAALVHFVTSTLFLLVYGAGSLLAGRIRFGAATMVLGTVETAFWLLWWFWLSSGPVPGIAIPELVGALTFGGWAFVVAYWKLDDLQAASRKGPAGA